MNMAMAMTIVVVVGVAAAVVVVFAVDVAAVAVVVVDSVVDACFLSFLLFQRVSPYQIPLSICTGSMKRFRGQCNTQSIRRTFRSRACQTISIKFNLSFIAAYAFSICFRGQRRSKILGGSRVCRRSVADGSESGVALLSLLLSFFSLLLA